MSDQRKDEKSSSLFESIKKTETAQNLTGFWDEISENYLQIKQNKEVENPKTDDSFGQIGLFSHSEEPVKNMNQDQIKDTFSSSNQHFPDSDMPQPNNIWAKIMRFVDPIYSGFKYVLYTLLVIGVLVGALGAGAGAGFFVSLLDPNYVTDDEELVQEIGHVAQNSAMYYADGSKIANLRSDLRRTPIPYSDMPDHLIQAVVATEDENFYEHEGIVPKAIIRAAIQQVTGTGSTGGSTITQQLVKQQILTNETTLERKANEMMLAMQLEDVLSKDQIMESYLNVSPFGRNNAGENIAGIQEAAQGIFGVNPRDLSLEQAAFLAGLPQSPIAYNPYDPYGNLKEDQSAGLQRYRDVLFFMYRENFISEDQYRQALDYDISQDFLPRRETTDTKLSYVYDETELQSREIFMSILAERDGIDPQALEENEELKDEYYQLADTEMRTGGYHIHITVDPTVHRSLNQTATDNASFMGSPRDVYWEDDNGNTQHMINYVQTGTMMLQNSTGRILGFAGGIDYELSNVNNAFHTRRQPGSTLKPLLVYGPALDQGIITPASMMLDTEVSFQVIEDGQYTTYTPGNATGFSDRWWSAREALAVSQNIPAIRIFLASQQAGVDIRSYARNLGIGTDAITDADFENISLALGGTTYGLTIEEMTAAFAAIANNGVYVEPYLIDRIEDSHGNIVYQHEAKEQRVFSEQTAFLLQDIMRDTFEGAGTLAVVPGATNFTGDFIGKTGTSDNIRDNWTVASNPEFTFGMWMGYENIMQSDNLDTEFGYYPSRRTNLIWSAFLNNIYEVKPEIMNLEATFQQPEGVIVDSVLANTGMKPANVQLPNGSTVRAEGPMKTEYFNVNYVPGPTTYDFAIYSTEEELREFWTPRRSRRRSDDSDDDSDESSNPIRDFIDDLLGGSNDEDTETGGDGTGQNDSNQDSTGDQSSSNSDNGDGG